MLWSLSAIALLACVSGCGMTTHDLIAHRAVQYYFSSHWPQYTEIIKAYPQAIQGGAPFPDYLYECGTDHDAGEAAHWPPFHAAAANVIRSRPKPWTNETKELIAFFFGVVSHYIADVNWHGLFPTQAQKGYGFIQTLGTQDFNCTGDLCPIAHGAADTGGEFVSAYTTNLSFSEPAKWIVPTKDLIEIFAQPGVNKTVTSASIEQCKALFIVGSIAIKDVGQLIYYQETSKAPFLQEMFIDHPLGGVDDMAVWTARMMNRFENWLENGPPSPLPPSFSYPRSPALRFRSHLTQAFSAVHVDFNVSANTRLQHYHTALSSYLDRVGKKLSSSRDSEDDVVLGKLQRLLDQMESQLKESGPPSSKYVNMGRPSSVTLQPAMQGNLSLGYLGSALASGDIDGDGLQDVIMSAYGASTEGYPQRGVVYIHFGGENQQAVLPIWGSDIFGRFGWAVTVLDFNLDGIADVVVSSPNQGWNWTVDNIENYPDWRYFGSVSVFFGNKARRFGAPDVVIASQTYLTHFGLYLNAVDVDEDGHSDLVIGSPLSKGDPTNSSGIQRGSVRVFLSSSKRVTGQRVADTSSDTFMAGPNDFAQFGHSVTVAQAGGCATMMVVGSPFFRVNHTAYGRITAFHKGQVLFTLTGDVPLAKFGFGVAWSWDHLLLAVSAPTYTGKNGRSAGAVYLLDQVALAQMASDGGDYSVSQIQLTALVESSHVGARFGWQVLWAPIADQQGDSLFVGAPFHSNFGLAGHQDGAVFVWRQDGLPAGNVLDTTANITVLGSTSGGRLGSALAIVNGSLYMGAPRSQCETYPKADTPGTVYAQSLE